jgi:lipoprotein-releasing system ATP-binding protein
MLASADLTFARGELTAILGGAGSGKTTLIRLMSGMELPDGGTVTVMGQHLGRMSGIRRAAFRNAHMGVVLKNADVLEAFTAVENTALPLLAGGMDKRNAFRQAGDILNAFGLKKRMRERAGALRTYERRIVSLARACVVRPAVILLDEPESDLSEDEKEKFMDCLQVIANNGSCTVICATADNRFASMFKRIVQLGDGKIIEEKYNE